MYPFQLGRSPIFSCVGRVANKEGLLRLRALHVLPNFPKAAKAAKAQGWVLQAPGQVWISRARVVLGKLACQVLSLQSSLAALLSGMVCARALGAAC